MCIFCENKIDFQNFQVEDATLSLLSCKNIITIPENLPSSFTTQISTLSCNGCTNLSHLPNWPTLTQVFCQNCPGLTSLPNWPLVIEVDCDNCTGLTL